MGRSEEALEMLKRGVEGLAESDKYKQFLDTMTRFHSYSANNCLLIASQRPDSSLVASYTAWRDKFHRQVKRGEKGITIIAPSPYKKTHEVEVKDENGKTILDGEGNPVKQEKEYTHTGFRTAVVFDVSQTEGEPLPSIVKDLQNPVEHFDDYMDVIRNLSPVPVRFDDISGSAKGYYSPSKQEIVLQREMPEEQTIKTFLHEVAHARLGHGDKENQTDKRSREVQAESIAYCCCRSIGLDTSDYSFGYVLGWSSGKDIKELKSSLQVIRDQADQMITGIEQGIQQIMEMRQEKMTLKLADEPIKIRMAM